MILSLSKSQNQAQTDDEEPPNQKENSKLSIAHLNTRSWAPTFDSFQLFMYKNRFDIVTISETWITNNKKRLDYVLNSLVIT